MSSLKREIKERGRPVQPRVFKLEKFTLHQEKKAIGEKPGKWKVSGRNSNGSYKRIRFDAFTLEEAQKKASEILFGRSASVPEMTIGEALAYSIKERLVKPETKNHYQQFASYFCQWAEERRIIYWAQISFPDIQKYIAFLIGRNLSSKTISHYLEPVRFTSLWMSQVCPERYLHFCSGLRLSKKSLKTYFYKDYQAPAYLTITEVCDFLDWIQANSPLAEIIRPGVALQGLCGLQLQEALRLTIPQVDLDSETITIEGEVKNYWRVRKIPIPKLVAEILRESIDTAPENDIRIVRHGGEHWKAYSSLTGRALDRWCGGKRCIPPKDLRNTLPTEATNRGWAGYFVNRYLGHAPQTMAERHYHGEVSRDGKCLVELMREKVVERVELLINYCTKLHDGAKVIELQNPA